MGKLHLTPAALAAMMNGDIDNAIIAMTPGGVEAQEAAGQAELVRSESIPQKRSGITDEQLAGLGFVLGDSLDDLFIKATLPQGWAKRPTDHSMWTEIVDEHGRKRFSIFYKAAFYDRVAFMDAVCFVVIRSNYEVPRGDTQYRVFAGGEIVWESECAGSSEEHPRWQVDEEMRAVAMAWVEENYPEHKNPMAYWN